MRKAKKREYAYAIATIEQKVVTEEEFLNDLKKIAGTGQGEMIVFDYLDCKGLEFTPENVFDALKVKIDTKRKVRVSNKVFRKVRMRG